MLLILSKIGKCLLILINEMRWQALEEVCLTAVMGVPRALQFVGASLQNDPEVRPASAV